MNEIIPKTKKECFAQLDEMLSEEDKQAVVESDVFELHFTLGLWIRNNWLYPQSEEGTEKLLKDFGEDFVSFDADDCSSIILEAYQKHLRRKTRTE